MRESATEVTWSNGEISAFVDFSRPRLPAGCTSKASLRLHRHYAQPDHTKDTVDHCCTVVHIHTYPTHPSDMSHHLSPFCTDWTLSARAHHPESTKALKALGELSNFCTPICWFQRNAYANTQILASYDMWRLFAWENSEQASNSISFKFKQISVENLRMVSPFSRWGVCQAWCHEAPLQRSTWIVTTWVERTWIQRLHTFISKDKGLSYGLRGQGRTNLRAALLMLDSHQSPLHRIRCTYGIWS